MYSFVFTQCEWTGKSIHINLHGSFFEKYLPILKLFVSANNSTNKEAELYGLKSIREFFTSSKSCWKI